MTVSQNPRYFAERTDAGWKTLSCGGVVGLLVAQSGGSVTAAAMAASLFILPTLRNVLDAHRERHGDKSPLPEATDSGDRRGFKEAAAYRWINELKSKLSFEDFVTELADCSMLYGRRFSVISVKIAGLSKTKIDLVADLLRAQVRATDEIKRMADDEFVICSPLLRDAISADTIVKRLEKALSESKLLEAQSTVSLGKALCPRDGYSGPDLINAARSALRPVASQEMIDAFDEDDSLTALRALPNSSSAGEERVSH